MNRRRLPSEFELIARYLAPLAEGFEGARGLGDDAAVIPPASGFDSVATVDALVEGVHFLGDDPPASIGKKLLRVSLSDLAAMGARPHLYFLTLALSEKTEEAWVADFTSGLAEDQKTYDITLAGGDTVATSGPTTLSLTALGQVPSGKALARSGAGKGDAVYVTGTIGDGALGLAVLNGGCAGLAEAARAHLVGRYRLPEPRTGFGEGLVGLASAAIDVSDGLVADLGHLAEQSGCRATVEAARVPLSEAAEAALGGDRDLLATILAGGDDYELLFTADAAKETQIQSLAGRHGLRVTRIGDTGKGAGVQLLDPQGAPISLGRQGYRHF
ncbi:MAG: thiamine-phosphate kinase [Alphaproteobacteria bacterium]|nr:thiamine-phosphate kinase [Alphaproteobacteria bacterium]